MKLVQVADLPHQRLGDVFDADATDHALYHRPRGLAEAPSEEVSKSDFFAR